MARAPSCPFISIITPLSLENSPGTPKNDIGVWWCSPTCPTCAGPCVGSPASHTKQKRSKKLTQDYSSSFPGYCPHQLQSPWTCPFLKGPPPSPAVTLTADLQHMSPCGDKWHPKQSHPEGSCRSKWENLKSFKYNLQFVKLSLDCQTSLKWFDFKVSSRVCFVLSSLFWSSIN